VIKLLITVLKKGLGNRVNQLCALPSIFKEWECTENVPDSIGKLTIGLDLNPETCFDIVEKGPEANLSEVSNIEK
jgi:U3 small nucleolar RNA-associated protein 22